MKAHILLYFGGYFGPIPEALKGIDCIQQNNFMTKINIIENINKEEIKNLRFVDESQKSIHVEKKTIDESDIFNSLKDAWKELEKLSSKLNDFKSSLMNNNETKEKIDLLEKLKKTEKDQRKIFIKFYLISLNSNFIEIFYIY
jgi:predicted Rossmann-fold nucleotide-binding protein